MRIDLPAFANKADLYSYLVKRKEDIFQLKRNEVKKSETFMHSPILLKPEEASKAEGQGENLDTDFELKRRIVGNTYYWMDSHEDVHLSGCFAVSIKQRGAKKIYFYHDHLNQLTAKVGNFEKVYEKEIAWKDLGIDKEGNTESLFADAAIKKAYNEKIFEMYKSGEIDQHSVGMQYVKLDLAINDPEYKAEYAEWQKVYPLLGNPETADKTGYFFTVKEARLFEISCVPDGSNILTPTQSINDPSKDSQEHTDPSQGSQTKQNLFIDLI